ncbi:Golgin subfamily A member 7/ERF4 family-domain-containing protein [Mycena crocata]|nr:Golgin subfamily A member 7/ERF4 family-domain-containing protein [Mycena crocata]
MTAEPPSPQEPLFPAPHVSHAVPTLSSSSQVNVDANAIPTVNAIPTQPQEPPADVPPSLHGADSVVGEGPGEGGLASKGDDGEAKDEGRGRQRESSIWPNDLPPSPPLTRPNTGQSERPPVEHELKEKDITDLDPLQAAEKTGSEDSNHDLSRTAVGEHGGDGEETGPKPRATVVRQPSRIQLDAKLEPQPWDLVDPPETNGQTNAEYYASVKTQKYNTLHSSRARALIPKSSYYFGPPPSDSAYGTQPIGQIGVHHPREILRVERDYTGGELIQFAPIYPLELEGRITPTQFLESINAINELLISAHSLRHSFLDNFLAVFTLQLSRVILTSHYEKEMLRLQHLIQELNAQIYNPVGLNIMWPRPVAFLFVSRVTSVSDEGVR